MSYDVGHTNEQAHELIERLPPTQLAAVVGLLEATSRAIGTEPRFSAADSGGSPDDR